MVRQSSGMIDVLGRMHPRNIRHRLPTQRARDHAGAPPRVISRREGVVEAEVRVEDAALYDDDELCALLRVSVGRVERSAPAGGWIRVRIVR